MNLHIKYRPKNFDEIIGNDALVSSLRRAVKSDPPHAFLFIGPTGCGKTTLIRIIARELGCADEDYREIDSAHFTGVDSIRDIRKQAQYKALGGGNVRVWALDEVHQLSNSAQSALLKALEDPPPHAYFLLATTEPQKLLPTLRGRCSQYEVAPLEDKQMMHLLMRIVKAENESLIKIVYDQIIQDAMGLPRNAIQVLNQVLCVEEDKRLEIAKKTAEEQSEIIELCRALIKGQNWQTIAGILRGLKGQDAEKIRRVILGYCQSILLRGQVDMRSALIMEQMKEPFYDTGFPGLVLACFSILHGEE